MTGNVNFQTVALAVLAGGAASRMGRPKASLQLHGQSILRYLLDRYDWPGPKTLVLAPGHEIPIGAERFDQIATDPVAGAGPLRGILTALESASTQIVIVATVDMPGVAREQLEWIGGELTKRPELSGVMSLRTEGQIEPFPSAYRMSTRSMIADALAQQRRSVHGLLKIDGFKAIPCPSHWPAETWANLNTPQDLSDFTRRPASR